MRLPVTMQKTIYNTERPIIKLGMVAGRNILMKSGFVQCQNPAYYEKEGQLWHYNKLDQCWYTE